MLYWVVVMIGEKYLLSIDPGVSTGITLLSYTDNTPPELKYVWQFSGGALALDTWIRSHQTEPYQGLRFNGRSNPRYVGDDLYVWPLQDGIIQIITEKFTARHTEEFSYTTESLEPLRCEGVLLSRGVMSDYDSRDKTWRSPSLQYLVGGKDKVDKKKRQHRFLEDSGYYIGRKEIGETLKDYDDARSATAHGLNFLARELKHRPTFDLIQEWTSTKGVETR